MVDDSEQQRLDYETRRRERRERTEPILQRICSELNIDEDVSRLGLYPAPEFADLFPDTQILAVTGCRFERPALPSSSYMYCAFTRGGTGRSFVELTPRNSALKDLLRANWDLLPNLPVIRLAHFILTMDTVGTVYHEVLADMSDLDKQERRDEGFVLNDRAIRLMNELPTSTSIKTSTDSLLIRVLTLHGWMHEKQNLGVTDITIPRDGRFVIGERQTICDPVFQEIPAIWY